MHVFLHVFPERSFFLYAHIYYIFMRYVKIKYNIIIAPVGQISNSAALFLS